MRYLVATLFLCLSQTFAVAHSFYSNACCDNKDCFPATKGEVREDGVRGGYVVQLGEGVSFFVPYGSSIIKRTPPDQEIEYHYCIGQMHSCEGGSCRGSPFVRCLYVPGKDV